MWNVYRVSDLNNFNYTKPTTFPRYGRILSRYLVDSFSEAVTMKATLVLKPELQGFEGEDPPVYIKIEDTQLDKPRLVYEGMSANSRSQLICHSHTELSHFRFSLFCG